MACLAHEVDAPVAKHRRVCERMRAVGPAISRMHSNSPSRRRRKELSRSHARAVVRRCSSRGDEGGDGSHRGRMRVVEAHRPVTGVLGTAARLCIAADDLDARERDGQPRCEPLGCPRGGGPARSGRVRKDRLLLVACTHTKNVPESRPRQYLGRCLATGRAARARPKAGRARCRERQGGSGTRS